ncbi:hypothetical protein [Chryseobacterium aquaticum]|uniref:Type II toxin-antitoxin system PemK/MazF family toxin n=1 Tax=Chryseobacterium aquaticum subsp. greenlandense TaxID=345663 RepID=A0A124F2R8_9FLAO|nr:hypothetical protein [Chryseobacterium aquaticum]KUJ55631.1 hypothetical protein AR686_12535 [Chryseobacterium aquaticum subsp. greenlandense]
MEKGQIFWAKDHENHQHPIVFLKAEDEEKFLACILSTKDTNGNKPMSPDHFFDTKKDGSNYSIKFKTSHLIPSRVFIKEFAWLKSLNPDGMLTKSGIDFIDDNLNDAVPEFLSISIKADSELK